LARILAFVPDLLFGSNVVGAFKAAGHDVELVSNLASCPPIDSFDLLVVDLTADAQRRIDIVKAREQRTRSLAFYSHVEADVRESAISAGFDLVVPRSRMAREGPLLANRLLERG